VDDYAPEKQLSRRGRPDGALYVLVGDKPGETVEVDWRDIAPAAP
jgi:hypothetical protein